MNLSQHKSTKLSILILIVLLLALVGVVVMKRHSLLPLFLHGQAVHPIKLPAPVYKSNTSVEEALKQRRSIRKFKNEALSLQQVTQLLWAAQGITSAPGFRTAPSAGGIYPLEIYIVTGNVQDLSAGVYHYLPAENSLELVASGDKRKELAMATHNQNDIQEGAIDLVITGIYKRTTAKYGNRGERFVDMEAGHAAQNVYLQAVSLGLGTVGIGAFDESAVKRSLSLPKEQDPLYLMPIGKP